MKSRMALRLAGVFFVLVLLGCFLYITMWKNCEENIGQIETTDKNQNAQENLVTSENSEMCSDVTEETTVQTQAANETECTEDQEDENSREGEDELNATDSPTESTQPSNTESNDAQQGETEGIVGTGENDLPFVGA